LRHPLRPINAARRALLGGFTLVFGVCLMTALPSLAQDDARVAPQEKPQTQTGSAGGAKLAERTRYRVALKLDFDARAYQGTARVRWVNRENRPASVLYFHLYPNLRDNEGIVARGAAESVASSQNAAAAGPTPDEPRLEITEVRSAQTAQPLAFSRDDQETVLRVQLREAVTAGAAYELDIKYQGTVPEIDPDETSLSAHVIQQVGAALRESREVRRARDTNFHSRGVMLLGSAYPVLAVREGGDWQRKVEPSVGDVLFTDVADYEVTIDAPLDVALFTSGEDVPTRSTEPGPRAFAGENLRGFAVVAGRALRSAERNVSGLRVRSIYTAEHETTGRRVLGVAAEAARVFEARFGALPRGTLGSKTISVTEAPLVAGLGSAEFAGLGVIASAFYVDFDAPSMRNLPEIVREQRASVEDSLEFTVAHVIAHEWWGTAVGSDPARAPFLDEALAHWSALLYYKDVHGMERARLVQEDQLRGVYQIYRTFGGEDMAAERDARDYRNSFQYAAIVAGKGGLMFVALRKMMGDEKFFAALRTATPSRASDASSGGR
jgi:hypothetical protein